MCDGTLQFLIRRTKNLEKKTVKNLTCVVFYNNFFHFKLKHLSVCILTSITTGEVILFLHFKKQWYLVWCIYVNMFKRRSLIESVNSPSESFNLYFRKQFNAKLIEIPFSLKHLSGSILIMKKCFKVICCCSDNFVFWIIYVY
jgi:hypothetical protein